LLLELCFLKFTQPYSDNTVQYSELIFYYNYVFFKLTQPYSDAILEITRSHAKQSTYF
jgi:hypothetical protein